MDAEEIAKDREAVMVRDVTPLLAKLEDELGIVGEAAQRIGVALGEAHVLGFAAGQSEAIAQVVMQYPQLNVNMVMRQVPRADDAE